MIVMLPPDLDDGATTAVYLTGPASQTCPVLYVRPTIGLAEPTEAFAAYNSLGHGVEWLARVFSPPYVFRMSSVDWRYTTMTASKLSEFIQQVVACPEDFERVLNAFRGQVLTAEQVLEHAKMQMTSPRASRFPCQICEQYRVDIDTFTVGRDHSGKPYRLGQGEKPYCQTGGRCPKGDSVQSLGVSHPQFRNLWRHYWTYSGSDHRLKDCPRYLEYSAVIRYVVTYGDDPRFNPIAGGSSARKSGAPGSCGVDGGDIIPRADDRCLFCGEPNCRGCGCQPP